jgi:hypothetical protein
MQPDAFKARNLTNRCLKRLLNKHIVGKHIRHKAAATLSSVAVTKGNEPIATLHLIQFKG